ncbi:MAG: DUF4157 domain-containing protein [Methylotetracoccus sp.]
MQTHATSKPSASHASKPFFGSHVARATSFFSPTPAIQTKLTVGEPGDRFEREADTVADAVVQRMATPERGGSTVPSVQAKCAKCEHEEMVRRQAETNSAPDAGTRTTDTVQQGIAAQSGAGQALAAPLRQEMEQGIGADFSGVRIHTGAPAASLNEQLNARAFTHGQDVFFNSGQFDPGSSAGRHLLAHELTHVVQQSGDAPGIQRDDAGGGSTDFTDTVSSTVRSSNDPVIRGTVTRTETAPASGSLPREEIHRGTMNVEFNPTTCVVTIPFGYRFVQAAPADRGACNAGPNHTPLSPTEFATLKSNVLRVVNAGLNGWFDVQLSGSGCPSGCSDRRLPIRVVATENDANPDTTITVVNRAGRANAGTICVRSWNDTTAVHEGGHQVLGVGDEYPERDESLRASVPQWFRTERVRRDYSRMGPDEHSRFAMFQARHFAAVTAFLQNIYPNCTATLVARARPIIPDFRISLALGYASVSGVNGFFLRSGLDLGIPLDRMRRWELTLGPEFTALLANGDRRYQSAFLLGARLGLEGSTGDAGFGVTGGPFLSAGYGWFDSHDYGGGPGVGNRSARSAYGELGGRLGIRTGLSDGMRFNLSLEGAAGSALGAPGIIGPVGRDVASDPARTHWFRVGLGAVLQF